jgi:hypothetical protein
MAALLLDKLGIRLFAPRPRRKRLLAVKALKKEEEAVRFKAKREKIEAMGKMAIDRVNLLLAPRESPTPDDI